MDNKNTKLFIVRLLIAVVIATLLVGGGTFAYWRWMSDTNKNVVFSTVENIEDYINYDEGNSYFVGDFQPTSTFCQSTHTTLSFSKKEIAKDMKFVATIHMDVNAIGTNIAASDSVYWVVTTGDDDISCGEGLDSPYVINYGTFNGKTAGDSFALTSDVELLLTTSEKKFTVWIWLDRGGDDLTSLTGETIDTNIWTQIDMLDNMYSAKENAIGEAYAVYSADDNSLRFYRSEDPIVVGTTYNNKAVTAVYTGFEDEKYNSETDVPWYENRKNITTVVVEDSIYPVSTNLWFALFLNCSSFNVLKLNTSLVTDMIMMFGHIGMSVDDDVTAIDSVVITGLDNFDTSNVTNMLGMFTYINATFSNVDIGDISGWDTSNVTNMYGMFTNLGASDTDFSLGDISGWDTSNVTDMQYMFSTTGRDSTIFSLDLSGWNVDKVTAFEDFNDGVESKVISPNWVNGTAYAIYSADDNSLRFYRDSGTITAGDTYRGLTATNVYTGFEDTEYSNTSRPWYSLVSTITDVIFEDVIKPISTKYWFAGFMNCYNFDLVNLNTSNVTSMSTMFNGAALYNYTNNTFSGVSNFNTSNVTDMSYMFNSFAKHSTNFSLDLSKWNTSKVTNMTAMFQDLAADEAQTFSLLGLTNWDTSKVTSMDYMFNRTGLSATGWSIDLSDWDVSNVNSYHSFNSSVETKVIAPAKFSS